MSDLLTRIVVAAIVGALVFAVCMLIGPLLNDANVPIIGTVGKWLVEFATLFGLAAAILWFAFRGGFPTRPTKPL